MVSGEAREVELAHFANYQLDLRAACVKLATELLPCVIAPRFVDGLMCVTLWNTAKVHRKVGKTSPSKETLAQSPLMANPLGSNQPLSREEFVEAYKLKACFKCGAKESSVGRQFMVCGGCEVASYCS
jgi:hypothetical protein